MRHVLKRALQGLLGIGLALFLLVLGCLGVMYARHPLPAQALPQPPPGAEPEWWVAPPSLDGAEVAAQQWLADITYRLSPEEDSAFWDIGGSQHGNFSIRYQAAFAGYAAAAFGMRTPAYPGLTARVISNAVARIADRKAWAYIQSYWRDAPWFPDPCARENIMYTGHLMMLMALEEALSGNARFNEQGVTLIWDEPHRFTYTTLQLANLTAEQMREGTSGISCEPGLIFLPATTIRM